MVLISIWCSLQIAHEDFKLDAATLLSAFSFENKDGQREKVGPWHKGPNSDNNEYCMNVAQGWVEETHKAEMVIPTVTLAGGRDIVNIIREGGVKANGKMCPPREYKQCMVPCKHCSGLNRAQNAGKPYFRTSKCD